MMKRGFTLVELLIVMVIVGLLVTMALPKYKSAMEKGRGVEALHNAAAVSDAVNAYYVRNGNNYGSEAALTAFALGEGGVSGITYHSDSSTANFALPSIALSTGEDGVRVATVSIARQHLGSNNYRIDYINKDGDTVSRTCTTAGEKNYCQVLGAQYENGLWVFP